MTTDVNEEVALRQWTMTSLEAVIKGLDEKSSQRDAAQEGGGMGTGGASGLEGLEVAFRNHYDVLVGAVQNEFDSMGTEPCEEIRKLPTIDSALTLLSKRREELRELLGQLQSGVWSDELKSDIRSLLPEMFTAVVYWTVISLSGEAAISFGLSFLMPEGEAMADLPEFFYYSEALEALAHLNASL